MIENLRQAPLVVHRGKVTFNEFGARIKAAAQREYRELRSSEGDIPPRAWFYVGERIFEQHLQPEWFSSREAKDILTQQIVKMVEMMPLLEQVGFGHASGVNYVGLVYVMFGKVINMNDLTPEERAAFERNEIPPTQLAPLDDPNAEEIISVVTLDREVQNAWNAPIKRKRGRPPRLGGWDEWHAMAGMPTGLMIEPIKEALR
jgi:hypothetical protein